MSHVLAEDLRAAGEEFREVEAELLETMVDARRAGYSISVISRLTGIPRMTVSDRLKKADQDGSP